jgi:ectoine hydroxylase-related dioxygenase (phytanoyl-CoA dioxygenase family)
MAAHPARQPTEAEIRTLEEDGAVALRGVYQPEWVELLREGVAEAMRTSDRYTRRMEDGGATFFTDYVASSRVAALKRFALEGPAAELGGRLMRSKRANFLFDGIFVKEPGSTKPTAWHQDQPYYCVQGRQNVVLWAPLDPCPASVSLHCVKGSHTWGKAFRPIKFRDGADFGRDADDGYLDPPDVEREHGDRIMSWDLEPGDVVAFHGMTIHGAPGNLDNPHRRRATNTTWVGDDGIYIERPGVMEPDFPDCGLKPGDPIDSAYFPRVFDAGA